MVTEEMLQQKTKEELLALVMLSQEKTHCAEKHLETIERQKQTIIHLTEQLRLGRYHRFAAKSEKDMGDVVQYSLFDEAKEPDNKEEIEAAEEEITVAPHKRKKGRKPLPKELKRVEKIYDLTDEEKNCPCGCQLTCIGEEESEQLDIIPATVQVIVHIRKKYACRGCESTMKQAQLPAQPIPKSIATPGTLAHVLVSKFEDHLPLYRQEKTFQRMGIDIPRATLSNWVLRSGDLFKPLNNLLQSMIETGDIAYADETGAQVLNEPGRAPQQKGYMWLFGGGPPEKFSFVYRYDPGRAHTVPLTFLGDFKGYLHCDGFSAYDTLANKSQHITLVGCWYHARRKFVEAEKVSQKKGLASKAIATIKKLSAIEREFKLKKIKPEQVYKIRQLRAAPILKEFKSWLDVHINKVLPESLIGKAISYTLSQWPKLMNYLKDGRLEISNNRTERGIKPFALGRKNWLFCNSLEGVQAAAVIYSLIETCKAHAIEPYYYLRYVLEKLPQAKTLEDFEALLPYNCKHLLDKPS